MRKTPVVCCAGEVMVELAPTGASGMYRRGAAGDTFNTAVYLAKRLRGGDMTQSIAAAQALAATVVQHRGAVIAREHMFPEEGK